MGLNLWGVGYFVYHIRTMKKKVQSSVKMTCP